VKFVLSGRLSNFLRRPQEQTVQQSEPATSRDQLGCRSELYSVHCIKADAPAACAERSQMRKITLVQMAFANCDIWIALPGDGVAFVEVN
jgi:hypothetical protein